MSELAPRSNPRLDNFETNKAAFERNEFEDALYADAGKEVNGKGNFGEDDLNRIKDADAYERHLETLSQRSDADPTLNDLNHKPSPAFEREWDDAIVMNESYDESKSSASREVGDKIADSPQLRRMLAMAQAIAELRNRKINEDNADVLVDRLQEKEDRLNDLLAAYSETDEADDAVIDHIIDSTVSDEAEADATNGKESENDASSTERTENNEPTSEQKDDANERPSDRSNVDTSWTDEENVVSVDSAESDSSDSAASDIDRSKVDTSWADEDDSAADQTPDDESGDGKRPKVDTAWADLDEEDDHEQEDESKKRFSWLRHPFLRAGALYQNGLDRVRNKLSRSSETDESDQDEDTEDSKESKKSSRKITILALGTIAVAGGVISWKLGAFDNLFGHHHGGGNGSGVDATLPGGGDTAPTAPTNPTTPEVVNFSDTARNVHAGEGWYETYQDMAIPQAEWHDLLQKTGPELQTHDWAYQMADGTWGISRPGTLPQDMLELIQKNR